jgi:hypothetical protein
MRGWAAGMGRKEVRGWSSGLKVEVVGHRLTELELWHRLGLGEIVRGRRIGEQLDLGRAARA